MALIHPEQVHDSLSRHMLTDGFDLVLDLRKSHGCRLYDARRKTSFLDFFSFFASSPVGFNHPDMITPDFIRKLGEIAVNKPSNSDIYTPEMAEFVDIFATIAKPGFMKYLFFISGGALAVENALKTAMDWKIRKNIIKGLPKETGHKVIHFRQAFHGRTGYTLSATNTFDPRKTNFFPVFDWPRIINPKIRFPLNEINLEDVKKMERQAINQIKKLLETDSDTICSLLIEPIQGEGGDNHFRNEFFNELRTLCDAYDILFIVDEIQTGIGITGKMWAFEHFDFKPDIIVFGKKTQVCGIMVNDRIDDIDDHVFKESSRINSTFGGNLVDMVRAGKYLEIINNEKLVSNASDTGAYLLRRLHDFGAEHSDMISNIRGRGLMCAFDLPDPDIRSAMIQRIYDNKMIVLPCGRTGIRFRPPLNVSRDDIEEGIRIISKAIQN